MKRKYLGMFAQERADDVSLDAFSLAMNETDFGQSGLPALFEIFFDDARNLLGLERMEIEMIFDGNDNGLHEWRFTIAHLAAGSTTEPEVI